MILAVCSDLHLHDAENDNRPHALAGVNVTCPNRQQALCASQGDSDVVRCIALRRLLEAVRHGVLSAAYKTEPCEVHGPTGGSKLDRAACWRYHTEDERLSRLVPKQHMCSFIKVSMCRVGVLTVSMHTCCCVIATRPLGSRTFDLHIDIA